MPCSVFTVQGIKVNLPFQPYPAQLAMMNKILQALKARKNCLIESPTGSGKSLALLCATLAWQRNSEENSYSVGAEDSPSLSSSTFEDPYDEQDWKDFVSPPIKKIEFDNSTIDGEEGASISVPTERDECHSTPKIFFCSRTHRQLSQLVRELRKSCYTDIRSKPFYSGVQIGPQNLRVFPDIAPVGGQLVNWNASETKGMTILASRQHTCIHPDVSRQSDKAAECRKLITGLADEHCPFYRKLKTKENERDSLLGDLYAKLQKESFSRSDAPTEGYVWDIEDLVKAGRKCQLCPYFLCTDILYRHADVVFCPYNYLLDPLVRKSMNISLRSSVVIIDEAHNVEDVCRESVSYSFNKEELSAVVVDLQLLADKCSAEFCDALKVCVFHFERLVGWMEKEAIIERMTTQEPGRYAIVWSGTEVFVVLKAMGLEQSAVGSLKKVLNILTDEMWNHSKESKHKGQLAEFDARILVTLEKLAYALHYLYTDKELVLTRSSNDVYSYCICLEKCASSQNECVRKPTSGWLTKSMFKDTGFVDYLHFWCMNPALAFNDISKSVRSVILASGTLCPMDTFAAELGVPFPIRLETVHVIPPERMYIGTVGVGPNEKSLKATYREVDSLEFQDELAYSLLAICKIIPDGVLCFLPSYRLLEKLVKRWQDTISLWEKINEQKLVLVEPRQTSELGDVLSKFHEAIATTPVTNSQCTGALLLAVYRGKVAEGIDFADRQARAVVTVGIPYPNLKDIRISLKRRYNDSRLSVPSEEAGGRFISGSQWFQTQAFRSLNQALGRCLRHREDWGALIMLDARFRQKNYCIGLSRWIRSKLQCCSSFKEMEVDLSSFVKRLEST